MDRICLHCCLIILLMPVLTHGENLDKAWEIALNVDHTLKAAKKNTESAKNKFNVAKSARLPQVNTSGGFTVFNVEQRMVVNSAGLPPELIGLKVPVAERSMFSYRLNMKLPIYTSKMIENGINAAKSAHKAHQIEEKNVIQNLKMKVAGAYIAILMAKRWAKVSQSHVDSLSAHAKDIENMHAQGFVAPNDFLSAQVALADARQQFLQAKSRVDIASAAYNRLLGRSLSYQVTIDELQPEIEKSDCDIDFLTQKAIENRSELKALSRQLKALHYQADMENASTKPHVGITSGYNYNENVYQDREGIWSFTIGVEWNIFDGSIAKNKSYAIKSKAQALKEQIAEIQSLIALQVRKAWLDIRESRERIKVTLKALGQAEENLKVAKNRYKEGLTTNTEVLDAEALRSISHSNYNNSIYDFVLATFQLHRATESL